MRFTRWLEASPRFTRPKVYVARRLKARTTALEILEARTAPVVGALAPAPAVALGAADPLAAAGSASTGVVAVISPSGGLGTGELLSTGRDILTAAHVVTQGTKGNMTAPLMVVPGFFKIVFYLPQEVDISVPSSSVIVNPGWTGNYAQGSDLAIIPLPTQAPAAAARYSLYTATNEVTQTFLLEGYGRSGNGTTGNDGSQPLGKSGSLRYAYNTYDATSSLLNTVAPPRPPLPAGSDVPIAPYPPNSGLVYDFDNGLAANDALGFFFGVGGANTLGLGAKEGFAAQGDSGGPGFIGNAIASIVSYGFGFPGPPDILPGDNNSFGEIEVDTRVSFFAGWINSVINVNRLQVTLPQTVTAGTPFALTVTAVNALGMVIPGFDDTVSFSSSDTAGVAAGTVLPGNYPFVAGDNGRHMFAVAGAVTTLTTAGIQSITATDTTNPTTVGFGVTTVNPAATSFLQVIAGSSPNPFTPLPRIVGGGGAFGPVGVGTAPPVQVVARDMYGNLTPAYRGTVQFFSSDAAAVIPATYMFNGIDGGFHTFSGNTAVQLMTAGAQTIRATDTVMAGITGVTTVRVTAPGTAVRLIVNTPRVTAGVPFVITVQAVDVFGDIATTFADTVTLTATDPAARPPVVIPGNHMFDPAMDDGTFKFTGAVLVTAGSQTITATDTANPSITGNTPVTVVPAATSKFLIQPASTNVVSNQAFAIKVAAVDQFNNLTPTYTGTVHFTTTDPAAAGVVVPGDYKFTTGVAGMADNGIHNFPAGVTLVTAGVRTIRVNDTVVAATRGARNVTVGAPVLSTLKVVASMNTVMAGVPFMLTVTAQDGLGNTITNYTGRVFFSSTDTKATTVLPDSYRFTTGAAGAPGIDNGVHTFGGVILTTAGMQTIRVRDLINGLMTTVMVNVLPAVAADFRVVPTAPIVLQGVPAAFTVTALDKFGNTATSYTGTVKIMSTDGKATTPPNTPFLASEKGVHTFFGTNAVTFNTVGMFMIGAVDTKDAAIKGAGAENVIAPAAVASLQVTILAPLPTTILGLNGVTSGTAVSVVVTALDANGFVFPYSGTIGFTSTDKNAAAKLPGNYKFTQADMGTHTFTAVVLVTRGRATITVTDKNAAGISGSASCLVQ